MYNIFYVAGFKHAVLGNRPSPLATKPYCREIFYKFPLLKDNYLELS